MNNAVQRTQSPKAATVRKKIIRVPSSVIEYSFYGLLWYQMLGEALGVVVPFLGFAVLFLLAVQCVISFGPRSIGVCRPIALALGCAILTILLQLVVHNESILDGQMRSFFSWFLTLIVVQSLCLRKGFFHRFALMAFLIGCATLPYLRIQEVTDEYVRMGASSGVALSNPNVLSMWFSFCMVYFMVAGLKAKSTIVCVVSWALGVLCLYVMGLTVSRGPILQVAIASTFVFQNELKRSFAPLLVLLIVGWIVYMTGLFDEQVAFLGQRSAEDTGRFYLWSIALNRFLDSWWAGVGFSNILMQMPDSTKMMGPHNSPLYIALASGIIPLLLFVGYLARAVYGAFRARAERTSIGPFKFPLAIIALLSLMMAHGAFMTPWHLVVFSMAMLPGDVSRMSRITANKKAIDSGHGKKSINTLVKIQPSAYRLT